MSRISYIKNDKRKQRKFFMQATNLCGISIAYALKSKF